MKLSSLRVAFGFLLGMSFLSTPAHAIQFSYCNDAPDCFSLCVYNEDGSLSCTYVCEEYIPCPPEDDDGGGGGGGGGGDGTGCFRDQFTGEVICPLEG